MNPMLMLRRTLMAAATIIALGSCSGNNSGHTATAQTTTPTDTVMTKPTAEKDARVEITTTEGPITVLLYGDTPLHRNNFLKLAKEGYYDGVLFHRVIKDFMVQTGDPESKNAPAGKMLGSGGPGYTLDAEIVYPAHYHKRGALAAARQGDQVNPQRRSSGSQFYIVTGTKFDDATLQKIEQNIVMGRAQAIYNDLIRKNIARLQQMQQTGDREGIMQLQQQFQQQAIQEAGTFTLPAEIKETYKTVGGTPHLDNQYTVFGEVLEGMDVVDKIQQAATNSSDRPNNDIKILSMKVVEE